MTATTGPVPLVDGYDVVLLDLDGTLYLGDQPVAGAAEHLAALRAADHPLMFVTNNASRSPAQVVEHLATVGIAATAAEVLTSAQAGARLVADAVPPGSPVLVVGGDGLAEAVRAEGLRPVTAAADQPVAVVQGWWPGLGWEQLAEGAYALAAGARWVATNVDLSLPTADGVAPGNGSFVAVLAGVTGRTPDAVAGKPGAGLLRLAAGGRPALVVGDRLDTDIEGAGAAGLDSLLVLTGVSGIADVLTAPAPQRPTYVSRDLGGLFRPPHQVRRPTATSWVCGPAHLELREDRWAVAWPHGGDPNELLQAACAAAWDLVDGSRTGPDPAPLLADLERALGVAASS